MRRRQAVKGHVAHTILLVGVLTCLCFSAGEGLRLMPIASPIIHEATYPYFGAINTPLNVSSQYQYATCGLEKSGQNLARRQQARGNLLTSRNSGETFQVRTRLNDDLELGPYRSLLSISRPLGRAPPSA
jgi:hypothetical protein